MIELIMLMLILRFRKKIYNTEYTTQKYSHKMVLNSHINIQILSHKNNNTQK
jgi:hypothetical protein